MITCSSASAARTADVLQEAARSIVAATLPSILLDRRCLDTISLFK
jgi:hypothetical protein